jgi:hypothetical protein
VQISDPYNQGVEELYSRRVATGKEITCLAWDASNEATLQLVNGTRDRHVQMWSFNGRDLHPVFAIQLATTIPKSIHFAGQKGADLYVFGIYSGTWYGRSNLLNDPLKQCSSGMLSEGATGR